MASYPFFFSPSAGLRRRCALLGGEMEKQCVGILSSYPDVNFYLKKKKQAKKSSFIFGFIFNKCNC